MRLTKVGNLQGNYARQRTCIHPITQWIPATSYKECLACGIVWEPYPEGTTREL